MLEFLMFVLVAVLVVFGVLNLVGGHVIWGIVLLLLAFFVGGHRFMSRF